jgi:hypothetical protein
MDILYSLLSKGVRVDEVADTMTPDKMQNSSGMCEGPRSVIVIGTAVTEFRPPWLNNQSETVTAFIKG